MSIFYHGTTWDAWCAIGDEEVLWGVREKGDRCTYLTPDIAEAVMYGEVLIQVDYDPASECWKNQWTKDSWQHREYNPIPAKHYKKVDPQLTEEIRALAQDRAKQYQKLDQINTFVADLVLGVNRMTVEGFMDGGERILIANCPGGRASDLNKMIKAKEVAEND